MREQNKLKQNGKAKGDINGFLKYVYLCGCAGSQLQRADLQSLAGRGICGPAVASGIFSCGAGDPVS